MFEKRTLPSGDLFLSNGSDSSRLSEIGRDRDGPPGQYGGMTPGTPLAVSLVAENRKSWILGFWICLKGFVVLPVGASDLVRSCESISPVGFGVESASLEQWACMGVMVAIADSSDL